MTLQLPDLSRYDVIGFDTETNGLRTSSRPTGCAIATPDGGRWYASWGAGDPNGLRGPAEMNNVDLPTFVRWAQTELTRPGVRRLAHHATFDLRMLAYVGIDNITGVECTSVAATLLDEHRDSFALNDVAKGYGLGGKTDDELHAWIAVNLKDDNGRAIKPTRKACAPHYWRVPWPIMAPYATTDAALLLDVHAAQLPALARDGLTGVYQLETALLPVLTRMHLVGTRVDRPRAHQLISELREELAELTTQWRNDWGDRSIRSPNDLEHVFTTLGIPYPLTPKTKKPSITKEFLETLTHPIGVQLRKMRQIEHYVGTFINGYVLDNTSDESDVLHPEFHALRGDEYGTITGRLSSGGELNVQNVPARDELWAPRIRSLFRPMHDGQQWLKIDYSQIEYRFFAHYAGVMARRLHRESAMESAYIGNPLIDFHQWVAETANIPRRRAKNVNFCRLYGGGVKKIAATAGCSIAEAQEFVDAYNQAIPEANMLMDDISGAASRRGFVITWAGRRCRFPTNAQVAKKYKRDVEGHPNRYAKTYKALNSVLQGSAADLIKRAMVDVDRAIDWENTLMHLSVHDELDFSVPLGDAGERVKTDLTEIMQAVGRTPAWTGEVMRVPVIAEADLGPNWGMAA